MTQPQENAEAYVSKGYAKYINPKIKEITIPDRIKNFNFVLINPKGEGKNPLEKGWQNKERRFNDVVLLKHLKKGFNYGVRGGGTSPITIDSKTYFLVVVDFDKKDFQDKILPLLPETFTTTSGSPKQCYHLWFACDDDKSFKIVDENRETLCDVIAEGKQIIAPGSRHPSGSVYSIVKDIPFAFISHAELQAILKPHDKTPKKAEKPFKTFKCATNDISEKLLSAVSMESILKELGVDVSKNPTNCPLCPHKKCFTWNDELCHCWSSSEGWNKYSLIRETKKLTDKQTFDWFADKAGMTDELKKSRIEFEKEKKTEAHIGDIFSTIGQARQFIKNNPIFYDKHGLFWEWNPERYCYESCDDIDVLNRIRMSMRVDTIDCKRRTEILSALKQVGREVLPKEKPKSWIQFKNILVDAKNLKRYEATPEYFLTNPFPHKIGDKEGTPIINQLFAEWVVKEGIQDESYVRTLKEISAYGLSDDLFMQRWFALAGSGSNGKGTWENFMIKLVGKENCVSFELKKIASNNFAVSSLYKKPIAFAGEVSYSDLSNTNQLKKLTGEDKMEYEFKGQNSFSDTSITTIYVLTNALPTTPDKSIGFYRRCLIVEFPNQFDIVPDLLDKVPEAEFENFCLQCINILHEMYTKRKFTNEGNLDDRREKYENKSNPLPKFIEQNCLESVNVFISLRDFTNNFNEWLKLERLRVLTVKQVGAMLRTEGYQIGNRKLSDGSSITSILNLTWLPISKTIETIETIKNKSQNYMENDFKNG